MFLFPSCHWILKSLFPQHLVDHSNDHSDFGCKAEAFLQHKILRVNSTIFCYQTKNKTAKTRKSLGWGKKKKLVRQWRKQAKQTELLNTLWHEDSPHTRNPYSQMCVRKITSTLLIPQPAENHTSTILCLSSCYNPCTTPSHKKKKLKSTLQTWEEDQTTFHQFLLLLTQKTQQYPEQESVDQAFHSPHPGPVQDPQFLHNKNNVKKFNHNYA